MKPTSAAFPENSRRAIDDPVLQTALGRMVQNFPEGRRRAVAALPEFDELRHAAREIRDHALAHLDLYLEAFEARVTDAGGIVHWCDTPEEARDCVARIARQAGASLITKGKSMVTEEIALNPHLEAEGFTTLETDLGEYVIQLAEEPPSHILGPAMHMPRERIADLFTQHHGRARQDTAAGLVAEARDVLRAQFFAADMVVTGANFLVAETGSAVIVTNEGNGDLAQVAARTHVVVTGIEKVIPTLEDLATLLRVLARSATGQELSVYTSIVTGPRRRDDLDGPEHFHIVLVNNGRSAMLAGPARDALRCIRCAACLNHCPVYKHVGGHAYGWVYSGPIGAAIDPAYLGLETARHLPNATSLCGRCAAVCPVEIPLPQIFRHWRAEAFRRQLTPAGERGGVRIWAWIAARPRLYRMAARFASRALRSLAQGRGRIRRLPFAAGWTASRDLPAPEGRTFFDQWQGRP